LERLLSAPVLTLDAAEQLADEVEIHPEGDRAAALLIALLERNPELDWGTPGPVVHAVERFFGRGYELQLLESVRRAPTVHTLWMLNRVVNGMAPDQRGPFLDVLGLASTRTDVPAAVRQAAREFLDFQRGR
jgi:hypothetical protein